MLTSARQFFPFLSDFHALLQTRLAADVAKSKGAPGTHFTCFTSAKYLLGTQFTCFTSTKVLEWPSVRATQFTCFTSTKVHILTQPSVKSVCLTSHEPRALLAPPPPFEGGVSRSGGGAVKFEIVSTCGYMALPPRPQEHVLPLVDSSMRRGQVLNLLALLVQKYKY